MHSAIALADNTIDFSSLGLNFCQPQNISSTRKRKYCFLTLMCHVVIFFLWKISPPISLSYDFCLMKNFFTKLPTLHLLLNPSPFCVDDLNCRCFSSWHLFQAFPKRVYHWQKLLRWRFFIPCDSWKTLSLIQILRYPGV